MTVKEFLKGFETIPPETQLQFALGNTGIVRELEPESIIITTNPVTKKDVVVVCFFPDTPNLTIHRGPREPRN